MQKTEKPVFPTYNIGKLKAERLRRKWNQTTLAFKAGISVTIVSKVESGRRTPMKAIGKMAEALGIDYKSLIIEGPDTGDFKPRRRKVA